mmetsp:Transcript_3854/g.15916  ORF Transcript_3854/g.15916 Transcript_3854/m.15916 type:complete len:286 (-) Transcript_3854:1236-2093(-)
MAMEALTSRSPASWLASFSSTGSWGASSWAGAPSSAAPSVAGESAASAAAAVASSLAGASVTPSTAVAAASSVCAGAASGASVPAAAFSSVVAGVLASASAAPASTGAAESVAASVAAAAGASSAAAAAAGAAEDSGAALESAAAGATGSSCNMRNDISRNFIASGPKSASTLGLASSCLSIAAEAGFADASVAREASDSRFFSSMECCAIAASAASWAMFLAATARSRSFWSSDPAPARLSKSEFVPGEASDPASSGAAWPVILLWMASCCACRSPMRRVRNCA